MEGPGWPVSALYEAFFAYGLSLVHQDRTGGGVSSLFFKMCKWGLVAVLWAGCLALPREPFCL